MMTETPVSMSNQFRLRVFALLTVGTAVFSIVENIARLISGKSLHTSPLTVVYLLFFAWFMAVFARRAGNPAFKAGAAIGVLVLAFGNLWQLNYHLRQMRGDQASAQPVYTELEYFLFDHYSPNTAVLFFLAAVSLLFFMIPGKRLALRDAATVTAIMILVSGAVILVSSVQSAVVDPPWVTPIPASTAFGFVMLGAGLLSIYDHQPRPYSYLIVSIVISIGIAASMLGFILIERYQRINREDQFDGQAGAAATAIQRNLEASLDVLSGTTSFFYVSNQITRQDYHTFTSGLINQQDGLQALAWVEKVEVDQRSDLENNQRRQGIKSFIITEIDINGSLIPAGERGTYYPVIYIEPETSNRSALGFDMASNPTRRKAMQEATRTGRMTFTPPEWLTENGENQPAMLVFMPVFISDPAFNQVDQPASQLRGFVVGQLEAQRVVQSALGAETMRDMLLQITDITEPDTPQMVFDSLPADFLAQGRMSHRDSYEVAGRIWQFDLYSASLPEQPTISWIAWATLLGGLSLSAVFGFYLLNAARHTYTLEQAELALRESELRYRAVVESASEAIVTANHHSTIITWNRGAQEIFGWSADEAIGMPVDTLLSPQSIDKFQMLRSSRTRTLKIEASTGVLELDGQRKNGKNFPIELSITTWSLKGSRYYSMIIRDATERKEAENRLRYLSTHDVLTGLYNRAYFETEVERLEYSRMFPVSVVVADLDDFKQINDNYGHAVGDIALQNAAEILRSPFRGEDLVARLGGDEFAVLLPNVDEETALSLVERIRHHQDEFNARPDVIPVHFSIGACTTEIGMTVAHALKNADMNMYRDKARRKNGPGEKIA